MKALPTLMLAVLGAMWAYYAHAKVLSKKHERYYQTQLCERLGGRMEYRLPDRSRVDCLNETFAVEVDFARKWAEGVGQSLYYAEMTGRRPAVGLIVAGDEERYLRRLKAVAGVYGIKIFIIEKE